MDNAKRFEKEPASGKMRGYTRREFVRFAGAAGGMAGVAVLGACGRTTSAPVASHPTAPGPTSSAKILDLAKQEIDEHGPLVLWSGGQQSDLISYTKAFKEATGLEITASRMLPGQGLPVLEQQLMARKPGPDVWSEMSDIGVFYQLRKEGHLLQYHSPQMDSYDSKYKSDPSGYWTVAFISPEPITYIASHVKKADAPSNYHDLLAPKWKGRIGFQNSSAGDQYTWWFALRNKLPKNYFQLLAQQSPRGYSSSTALVQDLESGDLLIAGSLNIVQYADQRAKGFPVGVVFPSIGTPAFLAYVGIIAGSKRPNAAKAFVDYRLSQAGQEKWVEIHPSATPRSDVKASGLPSLTGMNILVTPDNGELSQFVDSNTHKEFVSTWNSVVGLG